MSRYICSCLLLLWSIAAYSADSTKTSCWYKGFFLDVDVVEPAISIFSDDHKGANASLSVNLKNVFFPTVLVGYSEYDASSDYSSYIDQPGDYKYKVSGPYFNVGVDFNLLKSTKKYKPECYLGARYCFSVYNYEIDNVKSADWNENRYLSADGNTFAQWGEFVAGVRVPIYNRLYLGLEGCYKWSFSPKQKTFTENDGTNVVINQSYAPGFGDVNGTTWGFRYLVSFFF